MTKVKICGITNYEDAIGAVNLGADYLGFNFYKHSPRHIEKLKAKEIIEKLPKGVKKVGIFVNENISKIKEITSFCKLDMIQLSGDENPAFILNLRKALKKKIIKSIRIKNKDDVDISKDYNADYIMLDSFKEGFYGGTGKTISSILINGISKKNLFLAGGLNASNVNLAVQKIHPHAVDACSGIEAYASKKDYAKMKKFIEAVK